jgi:CubicO group peptidase (beta-lactamase class C family)
MTHRHGPVGSATPPSVGETSIDAQPVKGGVDVSVTTTATDLWRLSATELAVAIRTNQVSSRDVVETHMRRIEAVNPSVNAVTAVLADRALNAAEAADRATARGAAAAVEDGLGTITRSTPITAEVAMHEIDMTTSLHEILNRWPTVGLAVGVVRDGSLQSFHGHGVADIASGRPVTEDTVFRVASITKTFTGIAVMQLHEQGLVDLDAPANDYLRAYQLIPARAGFRPATVRHLLTHTAGLGEVRHPFDPFRPDFGESVPAGQPVPSLAEFYRGGLRIHAQPGRRWTYTDHGFATLGQLVADVSGIPLDRYLRERVFEPLGMADTDLVRTGRVRSRLATGYALRADGPRPVTDREMITTGASSAYSTPRDMSRYLAALLGGGANEHGTVLKPDTLAAMFDPQYRPDPRIPGMGLAFWRATAGGHRAVEHGGILPGFTSQIFVAPDDGVGVMAFTNGAHQAMLWLPGQTAGLLNRLLGVPDPAIRIDISQHPEIWAELCGWYALAGRVTDVRARALLGAGVEVFVRGGRLVLRGLSPIPRLYRGFELHPDDPDDPYVFRIDLSGYGIGTARVVFGRDPAAGVTAAYLEFTPMTLQQRPAATNPRRWTTAMLAAAAVTAVAARRRRHPPTR